MRWLLAIAVFLPGLIFLTPEALGAGTVPEGGTCEITAYPQKLIDADIALNPKIQVLSSTCQKSDACDAGAPTIDLGSGPTKGRILQYINSGGCDEAANYACCIYLGTPTTPDAPVTVSPGSSMKIDNPLGTTSILVVVNRVIMAFLRIAGAIALLVFVYAGFVYMTAGDSDRVGRARDAMKYAVIGLAIITFSYAIASLFLSALTAAAPA